MEHDTYRTTGLRFAHRRPVRRWAGSTCDRVEGTLRMATRLLQAATGIGRVLLACALVVSGCGERANGPSVIVSDSAGIPLYTLSDVPPWTDPTFQWELVPERSIPTGAESPGGEPLLYQPQAYARLDDGTLVVLDGGRYRIAILHHGRNEVLRRFGPSGQGPGEIWSSNSTIWPAGSSSFWLLDPGNQRLSRFSVTGALEEERSVRIAGMGGIVFQDPVEHAPWFWKIFVESEERTFVDSIGRLNPGARDVVYVAPMPPRVEQRRRNVPGEPWDLLAPMGWFAPLGPPGVVAGRNDSGRFRLYSSDGELVGLIDAPMEQAPIAESEKLAVLEGFSMMGAGGAGSTRRKAGDFYGLYDLMWGVEDSLFALQQSHLSTPKGERRISEGNTVWRIFSTRGAYAGAVVFPAGIAQPYWIERGRVIATHRDEFGVVTIQQFRVVKPERLGRPDP